VREEPPGLAVVLREWGRIGCIGFGGPPAHIALLRDLCVTRRGWLEEGDFEDAIAATNLLPGPASTQMAIYCAWRLSGIRGALVGGAAFIVPGLILILGLAALFLESSPPRWVLGAGAGAGAAVAAVALQAASSLAPASWRRAAVRARWIAYLLAGALAAATVGPWLVLLLLGCGAIELAVQRASTDRPLASVHAWPVLAVAGAAMGGVLALVWVAFKVGALSYGGGFVIIPLMQHDAVDAYHWMTDGQFLNAVALGQVTPGPVVHTVAVVGYAAGGLGGGLLAALVAFAPSFSFILMGADRFDRLRQPQGPRLPRRSRSRRRRRHRRVQRPAGTCARRGLAGRRAGRGRGRDLRAAPRSRSHAHGRRSDRRPRGGGRRPAPELNRHSGLSAWTTAARLSSIGLVSCVLDNRCESPSDLARRLVQRVVSDD
jgi:chromate transporter